MLEVVRNQEFIFQSGYLKTLHFRQFQHKNLGKVEAQFVLTLFLIVQEFVGQIRDLFVGQIRDKLAT